MAGFAARQKQLLAKAMEAGLAGCGWAGVAGVAPQNQGDFGWGDVFMGCPDGFSCWLGGKDRCGFCLVGVILGDR